LWSLLSMCAACWALTRHIYKNGRTQSTQTACMGKGEFASYSLLLIPAKILCQCLGWNHRRSHNRTLHNTKWISLECMTLICSKKHFHFCWRMCFYTCTRARGFSILYTECTTDVTATFDLINCIQVAAADIRNLPTQPVTVRGSIWPLRGMCSGEGRMLQTSVMRYIHWADKYPPHEENVL
jgi:hypothetical protein